MIGISKKEQLVRACSFLSYGVVNSFIHMMEKSRGFWLFAGIFLGIIVVGVGIFLLQNHIQKTVATPPGGVSSPEDQIRAAAEIQKWIEAYEAEMKEDTMGGETPEETLHLFIDALRKGDAELASRYTLLDINDPDMRAKWKADIEKKKREGRLNEIAGILSSAVYDASSSYPGTAWFSVLNKDGMADYSALLKLNKYSGVWKIESM